MAGRSGTSGVDWGQAANIGKSLLLSPLVGFGVAALLLLAAKALIKDPKLYSAPEGDAPPPFYIRCLLILTCTGVSFFHGSNDGQKGMGLIMLILIGTVPTAYALNHAVTYQQSQDFIAVSQQAARRARPLCTTRRRHRRRPRRRDGLHSHQTIQRQHDAGAAHPGQRHRQRNRHLQGTEERSQ